MKLSKDIMQNKIKIMATAILLLSLCSCAVGPRVEVDTSEAGDSPIGRLITNNFANSQQSTKTKITNLIVESETNSAINKKEALENLGLKCQTLSICTYHGKIRSKLIMQDGTVLPRNSLLDIYNVKVEYSGVKFKVDVAVETKDNQ